MSRTLVFLDLGEIAFEDNYEEVVARGIDPEHHAIAEAMVAAYNAELLSDDLQFKETSNG